MGEDIKTFNRSNGRAYSIRSNRDRFFYPYEWFKFFDKLKKSQRFTFEVLINTGARINEARHIKVGDIDYERNTIILRVTKVKAKKGEKNPRPRTIKVSGKFAKYLKKHLQGKDNDDYIGVLSTPGANLAMKKALKDAGIKDYYMFSIHNIRKTLECWLMALGIDGLKIVAHFGHSMDVAAKNYLAADIFNWEDKTKIREIIGGIYDR